MVDRQHAWKENRRLSLAAGNWIRQAHFIITGPTGAGKTYLACALANCACRHGFSAFYVRAPRLFQHLATAKADGSYPRLMNRLAKIKTLIIDDLGLTPLNDTERRDLLERIQIGRKASLSKQLF